MVYGWIASGRNVGFLVVLTTVPFWAAILRVPFSTIAPIIIVMYAIGAYTAQNAFLDVGLVLPFGVIGCLFKKSNYSVAPLVLALVLGDMAESSFRQSTLMSQASLSIFWSNWLVGSICLLALTMLFWPLISRFVDRKRPPAEAIGE